MIRDGLRSWPYGVGRGFLSCVVASEEGFQRQSGSDGWKLYGLLEIANIAKADMSVPHFPLRP